MQLFFRFLLIVFIFLSPDRLLAQKTVKKEREYLYPEWNIRTSLTSWADYDAGVMLGIGFRWSDRFSVAFEPTWIFHNPYDDGILPAEYPSGFKIRADLKYYPAKKRRDSDEFFIGVEMHYKDVKTDQQGQFGINCVNGQCAYFQEAIYQETKEEKGVIIKLGFLTSLPFVRDSRWLLEFYSGVGVKYQDFTQQNLPVGGSFTFQPRRGNFFIDENMGIPLLPAGVKLIFQLTKR